jgi:hypothetical protein
VCGQPIGFALLAFMRVHVPLPKKLFTALQGPACCISSMLAAPAVNHSKLTHPSSVAVTANGMMPCVGGSGTKHCLTQSRLVEQDSHGSEPQHGRSDGHAAATALRHRFRLHTEEGRIGELRLLYLPCMLPFQVPPNSLQHSKAQPAAL